MTGQSAPSHLEPPPPAPPGAQRRSLRLHRDEVSYLEWAPAGEPRARSVLLLHGLQSTALTMARIAEGLTSRGWRVVAPDLPGHGYTYALDGSDAVRPGPLDISGLTILRHRLSRRHRLRATARLVAELMARLGIDRPVVIGHSWGASVAATIAPAGLLPSVLVLLDPPFVTARQARTLGPQEMAEPTDSYAVARQTLLGHRADWHPLDLAAKAEALTRVSTRTMVAVVASNVPFDPLPALTRMRRAHPEIPVYVITGEPGHGSYVSESGRARLEALLGKDHVLVTEGAGHSPHRSHHETFMDLLLGTLKASDPAATPGRTR